MSNPGVIYLAKKQLTNGVEFRIEDNIGEAIHFHYGNEFRLDLTVNEFLSLEEVVDNSVNNLLATTGFNASNFDPIFLDMFSKDLIKLESVSFENIRLTNLRVQTKNRLGLPVIRPLNQSRVFKALSGVTRELKEYRQENFRGQSNLERVNSMKDYLNNTTYPFNNQYIVLFNNQNIIRDGQHRAACLLFLKGDLEIPVIRMKFKNNFNNTSEHPWKEVLFHWNAKRISKAFRVVFRKIKSILRRLKNKVCSH